MSTNSNGLNFVEDGTGYDRSLFQRSIPQDLICKLCRKVLNSPVSCPTGHMCCWYCIKSEDRPECPACRIVLTEKDIYLNEAVQMFLDELDMHCSSPPIRDQYCPWSGKLRDLHTHLRTDCEHHIVECSHKNCGFRIPRRDYEHHTLTCFKRPTACRHCGVHYCYDMIHSHESKCDKQKNPYMDCLVGAPVALWTDFLSIFGL